MSSITQDKPALEIKEKTSLSLSRERMLELGGLSAILLLAAWLRFSNLDCIELQCCPGFQYLHPKCWRAGWQRAGSIQSFFPERWRPDPQHERVPV